MLKWRFLTKTYQCCPESMTTSLNSESYHFTNPFTQGIVSTTSITQNWNHIHDTYTNNHTYISNGNYPNTTFIDSNVGVPTNEPTTHVTIGTQTTTQPLIIIEPITRRHLLSSFEQLRDKFVASDLNSWVR